MAPKISIFGKIFLVKSNAWANMSGKFGAIVREGLARPKPKLVILATPPPWFFDKNALSPAQREINERFANIARRTAGLPLIERIRAIKQEMTGYRARARAARAPAPRPRIEEVRERAVVRE